MSLSNLTVNIDIINHLHKPSILFSRTPKKHFDWDAHNFNNFNSYNSYNIHNKYKREINNHNHNNNHK